MKTILIIMPFAYKDLSQRNMSLILPVKAYKWAQISYICTQYTKDLSMNMPIDACIIEDKHPITTKMQAIFYRSL